MQEHYLARQEPLWYIGSRHVAGERLCDDIQPLVMAAIRTFLPLGQVEDISSELGIHTLGSFADMLIRICDSVLSRHRTKAYKTPRLFFSMHGRQATNPCDYIYGVRELLEPHFRQVFVPDYGLGTHPLFEKLAAWLLLIDGWGDMLWYYPFRPKAESETEPPSWAPDFSRRPQHLVNEPSPPKFSSDDPKTVHCAIVDRCLHIDGCHLDIIDEVHPIPGGDCDRFDVLQKLWRMDRIFCCNQRGSATSDPDRSSRALLAWATTMPATIPLAPRHREVATFLTAEFKQYIEEVTAQCMSSLEAAEEEATDKQAVHGSRVRGVGKLYHFLSMEMEGDFTSACVLDFENLHSQLLAVSAVSDIQHVFDLIPSSASHFTEIVYEDLIRAIEKNSPSIEIFRDLVSLVLKVAKKMNECRNPTGSDYLSNNFREKIRLIKQHIEEKKVQVRKLEDEKTFADSSTEITNDKDRQLNSLKKSIEDMEKMLKWSTNNETRIADMDRAEISHYDRFDEEKAAQFRGRDFFRTRTGLFGVTSPGVRGVKPGDRVVLLDGLSFPLIVRSRGESRLVIVGSANIRGVKLHHKVEHAELPTGVVGPKQTLVFV